MPPELIYLANNEVSLISCGNLSNVKDYSSFPYSCRRREILNVDFILLL